MFRISILCISILFVAQLAMADTSTKKSAKSDTLTYEIINNQILKSIKRSVDVRLSRRASKDQLRNIANEIMTSDDTEYERTFITFYLPDMQVGTGAWATAHSDPNLEIIILGSTEEEFAAMQKQSSAKPGREIIGTWYDEAPYASRKLVLYKENNKLIMESHFKDGSTMIQELIEKKSSLGRRLEEKEGSSFGEFYIINKNGDLEMRDSEGLIATAKKIKS